MSLGTAALWLHVLAGVGWIGLCGSCVLASIALDGAATESQEFSARALPRLNRLSIGCACIIALTGVINLIFAARAHGYALPKEFIAIVGVKLLLFATMAGALAIAIGRSHAMRLSSADAPSETGAALRGIAPWYGSIVVLGAVALVLGLWLAGM